MTPLRLAIGLLLATAALLPAADPTPLPDDPACTEADRGFMRRAYDLAADAVKKGNAPFGAVLVADGKIVAEGENACATLHDPTRHAELALISEYGDKIDHDILRRSTLYASSEPCTMCCGAILNVGIPKVVYGTTEAQFQIIIGDPPAAQPLTSREIFRRANPPVQVLGPLMEQIGLSQHQAYWPEAMKRWRKNP